MSQSRKWVFVFLVTFMTYPFWSLFINKGFASISLKELVPVLNFTIKQAFWSSVLTLFISFWGAFSFLKISSAKKQSLLRFVYIFPVMIPIITLITSFLELNFILGLNVYNIWGIVVLHSLIYSGLVSLQVAQVFEDKISRMSEVCWFYGVPFKKYFFKIALPVIYKDLLKIFTFTFAIFFTSFSIPYFLTGTLNPTLELLILQKIQIYGNWGQALSYASLQTLIIVVFALMLNTKKETENREPSQWDILIGKQSYFFNIFIFVMFLFFMFIDVPKGLEVFLKMEEIKAIFLSQLGYSLLLAVFTFFAVFIILCLAAFVYPVKNLRNLVYSYMAPSSVIVGFSLLRFSVTQYFLVTILIALGLLILLIPSLFRFQLGLKLEALEHQYEMAEMLGATPFLIFKKIIYPQIYDVVLFLSALAAFWAFGDFAVSVIVAPNDFTLSLMLKSLLSSYRLELASFYSLIILVVGTLLFFCFMGFGHILKTRLRF